MVQWLQYLGFLASGLLPSSIHNHLWKSYWVRTVSVYKSKFQEVELEVKVGFEFWTGCEYVIFRTYRLLYLPKGEERREKSLSLSGNFIGAWRKTRVDFFPIARQLLERREAHLCGHFIIVRYQLFRSYGGSSLPRFVFRFLIFLPMRHNYLFILVVPPDSSGKRYLSAFRAEFSRRIA